jgi:hypothetical protein
MANEDNGLWPLLKEVILNQVEPASCSPSSSASSQTQSPIEAVGRIAHVTESMSRRLLPLMVTGQGSRPVVLGTVNIGAVYDMQGGASLGNDVTGPLT